MVIINDYEDERKEAFYNGTLPSYTKDIPFSDIMIHTTGKDRIGVIIIVCVFPPSEIATHKQIAIPHAYVIGKESGKIFSRFRIDGAAPKEASELRTLFDTDPQLDMYAEKIVKWIWKEPRNIYYGIKRTNWEAMQHSWRDMGGIDIFS